MPVAGGFLRPELRLPDFSDVPDITSAEEPAAGSRLQEGLLSCLAIQIAIIKLNSFFNIINDS